MDTFVLDFSSTDGGVSLPGGGEVLLGGQPGPLIIGTTDSTDLNFISGGAINIGDSGNPDDQIQMNGSVGFQYTNVTTAEPTAVSPNVTLNATHYFVEITDNALTNVILPPASIAVGRQYIIVNGRPQTDPNPLVDAITVMANGTDTIDGVTNQTIPRSAKITIISNGIDKWFIV